MKIFRFDPFVIMLLTIATVLLSPTINGLESARKLDETTPSTIDPIKCSPSCVQNPPPPSPPPPAPCPPPPALPPPPPPPKKQSPTSYCPPPPAAANFLYMYGPPGNLYPVDQTYGSGSSGIIIPKTFTLVFIALGVLGNFLF